MSCNLKVGNLCTRYKMKCNIEPETMCAQYVETKSAKCSNLDGVICKIHGLRCDIPPSSCKDYENDLGLTPLTDWSKIEPDKIESAQWSNTHSDPTKIYELTTKPVYCKYCFNARVYQPTEEMMMDPFNTELTDENDSSSCGVGHCCTDIRFMISSGHGDPVRIEIDKFYDELQEWHTIGKYYPKYCPECGRRLNEYENDNHC